MRRRLIGDHRLSDCQTVRRSGVGATKINAGQVILSFASAEVGSSWIGVLDFVSVGDVLAAMADDMSPIDFLFYGIAIYEGFRFSLRTFDVPHADEELN